MVQHLSSVLESLGYSSRVAKGNRERQSLRLTAVTSLVTGSLVFVIMMRTSFKLQQS